MISSSPHSLLLLILLFVPNYCQSFTITTASLPIDLPSVQDCRRSAYEGKPVNLPAAKSFCNADQIQKENYICIIAKDKEGIVLGTADLNTKTNVVNNVYVRPTSRKQGIAKQMMIAVEDSLTKQKPSATLKLTVMSKNIPAVSLYKSLGFVAPGVYGALDAMPFNFLIEMEKKL